MCHLFGVIRAYQGQRPQHRSIEIGSSWLGLEFHGTGINRECKDLLLGYAFNDLGVNRIVLNTDVLNLRSRRAAISSRPMA